MERFPPVRVGYRLAAILLAAELAHRLAHDAEAACYHDLSSDERCRLASDVDKTSCRSSSRLMRPD